MSSTMELQPLATIQGAAGQNGPLQDIDKWINTGSNKLGILQAEVSQVSGCTLVVEGCDVPGGSFTTHAAFTQGASGVCMVYLQKSAPYGASGKLAELIRWRIDASAGAWDVTFKLVLVLK